MWIRGTLVYDNSLSLSLSTPMTNSNSEFENKMNVKGGIETHSKKMPMFGLLWVMVWWLQPKEYFEALLCRLTL